jgi:eukaryotic-like serine/threonine-protein kinase
MTRPLYDTLTYRDVSRSLPPPGSIVGGKYQIGRTLGQGGMGAVFEVTHCVTHKRFAIKWLLSQDGDGAEAVKRFIREAQIAGRIHHPNVVEIYDIYHEPPGVFMVMELLDGESLAALLTRRGRLGVLEALECLLGAMEGVAAVHAAGIVHRDIKPANIFLCASRSNASPQPKVLDFGVSQLAVNTAGALDLTTTRSGTVIGTPYYMAPEQMRAARVDARADVYALGITLYEVLSGVRPYDAGSYPDLIVKIAEGSATPLEDLCPGLPRGLAAVIGRAMAPKSEARYASVEALMHELQPFADAARRDQAAKHARVARSLISRRGLWVGAACLVLGGAAVSSWQALRAWPSARPARMEEGRRDRTSLDSPRSAPTLAVAEPDGPSQRAVSPAAPAAPEPEAPPLVPEALQPAKAIDGAPAGAPKRRMTPRRVAAPPTSLAPSSAQPRAGEAAPPVERAVPAERPPLWLERQGF